MFFFNDTASTEIYTLSLHDALPICDHPGAPLLCRVEVVQPRADPVERPEQRVVEPFLHAVGVDHAVHQLLRAGVDPARSEEHTSELQSHSDLVCRLLLEKKKKHTKR